MKLGLIHGKTSTKDREKVLQQFQDNKINILVTTPIIEVGIDIPNSTIMVIQSADRFGLAQLHQIRGRVGRGQLQSFCYLFTESQNEKAINRLKFLAQNTNGIKIAEYDLKNRGPGEAFSIIQHGFPSLRLASLSDLDLITLGQKIITDLQKIPSFNFNQILSESLPEQNIVNN
ncbi:Transcription-repair-coupling factor [bioreactor metagenome]|uniref:Transcription-repair-coupling factor n=1 Tax=bioreactor metagenome TaxID=1076179 RepID=A0A645GVJ7_9ZZZZ